MLVLTELSCVGTCVGTELVSCVGTELSCVGTD